MNLANRILTSGVIMSVAVAGAQAQANTWNSGSGEPVKGQYADVNGVPPTSRTPGPARPLVLFPGGLAPIEMSGPTLPALAKGPRVSPPIFRATGGPPTWTAPSACNPWRTT